VPLHRLRAIDAPLQTAPDTARGAAGALHTLAALYPRWGYRRWYRLLRREATVVNRKLVQCVYREEGLEVRRRKRKRVAIPRIPRSAPTKANERWSMDFCKRRVGGWAEVSRADHHG
jgi:putative transposase